MTAPRISTGAIEALKWLALVLMVGDHVNLALFDRSLPVLTEIARIVFPIFAVLLGFNLARPGVDLRQVLLRLVLVATVAQPFHMLAFPYGFLPLNVLWTFVVAVVVMWLVQERMPAAAVVCFLLFGLWTDYAYPGIGLVLATWFFFCKPTWGRVVAPLAFLASLALINGNFYALAALPVIALARCGQWPLQRHPRAFYVFYPVHLVGLAAVGLNY